MIDFKDLAGFSAPATKLIESVSNCIGVLYEPTRIRRKASAEAEAMLIMAEADVEKRELAERAAFRLYTQETRRQSNIESIIDVSLKELPEEVSPDQPDPDWVSNFFEECKDVSNEDLQNIWARLLAREVSTPGMISRRTVSILRQMGHREAAAFKVVCSLRWSRGFDSDVFLPHIFLSQVDFQDLYELGSLGLLFSLSASQDISIGPSDKLSYFGKEFFLSSKHHLPCYKFTRQGRELAGTLSVSPNWEHFNDVVEHLRSTGIIVLWK